MKIKFQVLLLIVSILTLTACGGEGTSTTTTTTTTTDTSTTAEVTNEITSNYDQSSEVPKTHNCQLTGSILANNQVYWSELDLLACIKADSTTLDENYGEGHRILELYDTKDCSRIFRKELPINESPDFPYYLNAVTIGESPMLLVRGTMAFYTFDPTTKAMSDALEPTFLKERLGDDAQSGSIRTFTSWENCLIGMTRDYGAFAFDMTEKDKPKAIKAFAEHQAADDSYHALFKLPTADGKNQLLLPVYDGKEKTLASNPLLDTPMMISDNLPSNVRDNRFLVLRSAEDAQDPPIAIDMQSDQRVELPADIATRKTQEILKWVKTKMVN
ncbi:MAG: hypothetical protein AAF798_12620 [Bacteroidota bacterium]